MLKLLTVTHIHYMMAIVEHIYRKMSLLTFDASYLGISLPLINILREKHSGQKSKFAWILSGVINEVSVIEFYWLIYVIK